MSVWEFCALASPPAFDVAAKTMLLADVLLGGSRHGLSPNEQLRRTPFGWQYGVCGVGAMVGANSELFPAISVVTLPPQEIVPLSSQSRLQTVLAELTRVPPPWFTDVKVVGVTPPQPQIAPGDGLNAINSGTVGCNVRWGGKTGFLTAGHVVQQTSTDVFVAGAPVGSSVYCNDPTNHGTNIEDDVAVVEVPTGPLTMRFAGSSQVGPNAPLLVVVTGAGGLATNVREYSVFQFSPGLNGTWGNLYKTTAPVTQPGHSGAPVQDAGGAVVGHVVGIMPDVGTLIQDIHYQLAMIGARSSLKGVRI